MDILRKNLMCRYAVIAILLVFSASLAQGARQWEVKGEEALLKGDLGGVSVLSTGELTLAGSAEAITGINANFIWDIKPADDSGFWVSTGAPGALYKIEDNVAELIHKTSEEHALSVLALPDESVLVATAPRGIVYQIAADGKVSVFADLDVHYVWDMQLGPEGQIFCATGPDGQLLELDESGRPEVLFQAPQRNLLSMALDAASGNIFLGTQPGGLVYSVDPDGNYTVLFDAEEEEIRDMIFSDGALYVSTAQSEQPRGGEEPQSRENDGSAEIRRNSSVDILPGAVRVPNSVYRIDLKDGAYRLARFSEAMVLSIARWGTDELLAGTGVDGRLIGIRDDGRTREVLNTGARHVSAIADDGEDSALVGTSNPARIFSVTTDYGAEGAYYSEIFDADYLSRWGSFTWLGKQPENTSVDMKIRMGNSREPDNTWSDWYDHDAIETRRPDLPVARFAQVKILLSSDRPDVTPEVYNFSVNYQQVNRPPVIKHFQAGSEHEQAGRRENRANSSEVSINWDASDPNQDRLESALYYRGVDEREWKELAAGLRDESNYRWDTHRVPDGYYLLKLVVSDEPSRGRAEAKTVHNVFGPILIDNSPPVISDLQFSERQTGDSFVITGIAGDPKSRITSMKVSHNAGDWKPVFPDDGIFDSPKESFTFITPDITAGEHVFVFTAEDAAGNVGSGKIIIDLGE